MKRLRLAFAAAFALGLGMSGGVSALDADPGCMSTCQELMNDCLAIAEQGGGGTRHCFRFYRDCIAGCTI